MSNDPIELLSKLDELIRELEQLPYPEVRDKIFDALQLIDMVHRPALATLSAALEEAGTWEQVLESPWVHHVAALYDLVSTEPVAQAERALDSVRPYLQSHGGEVEVLGVEDGKVHVRLQGACEQCSASASTLQHGVQKALEEGFPGFTELVVQEVEPQPLTERPGLVQLRAPVFTDLLATDELADRQPKFIQVQKGDNGSPRVLIVRADNDLFAYPEGCAACGMSLEGCMVQGDVLICSFSNCAYDIRNGRRVDGGDGPGLQALPVTEQAGRVLLAARVEPQVLLTQPKSEQVGTAPQPGPSSRK